MPFLRKLYECRQWRPPGLHIHDTKITNMVTVLGDSDTDKYYDSGMLMCDGILLYIRR